MSPREVQRLCPGFGVSEPCSQHCVFRRYKGHLHSFTLRFKTAGKLPQETERDGWWDAKWKFSLNRMSSRYSFSAWLLRAGWAFLYFVIVCTWRIFQENKKNKKTKNYSTHWYHLKACVFKVTVWCIPVGVGPHTSSFFAFMISNDSVACQS